MSSPTRSRILILGGGFAGAYTAYYLERLLGNRDDFTIALVNKENYFVFQPLLAEIISGNIGILDTVSPLRRLLKRTDLYVREIESVDLEMKTVTLSHGFRPRPYVLSYDHLVIALGSTTNFRGMAGLQEHALPFKNLADAIFLRNHLIHTLEEATIETDPGFRRQLLTFVIAGGGFSGVEVAAELNDFVRRVATHYRSIDRSEIRVILIHSGKRILDRELAAPLSLYAQSILEKRGIEFRLNDRLRAATPDSAVLSGGERIDTKTLISTVPSAPHPLVASLPLPAEKGKLKANLLTQVEEGAGIWALGDCALIPDPSGNGFCPPTAQHAIRQAKITAHNIAATIRGEQLKPFTFRGLGKMGALGHRSAVVELLGRIKQSGFLAWLMWRTVYWWKLPGLDRKLKVGIAWALDLLIPPELVQLKLGDPQGVSQAHFEAGEAVFEQGDLGDRLYIILRGEAEVVQKENGMNVVLARLGPGEYFGEMALLNQKTRGATVRCVTPMDVLAVRKGEFSSLVANLPDLRRSFEQVMEKRTTQTRDMLGQTGKKQQG
jgi:NADH dehydrogenase